jgi:SAM-dependent methyltransferase|tara:strand:- start:2376 stop:3089 length:714 start_codon:yes stop_codon:yes gene_type:complete
MKNETFERHLNNEKNHWWFKGRREILSSIIKINFKKKSTILDFGSGSGTNIDMLCKYGTVYIYEKNKKMKKYLKKKYSNSKKVIVVNNYKKFKYDLIIAADVIEHIKNDKKAIKEIGGTLKKNGKILITVPAFQLLFSKKDEQLKHFRRYNINTLKILIKNFKTIKLTYFNFFLFIPLSFVIIILKTFKIDFIDYAEKTPNIFINKFFYYIFRMEKMLVNFINFPFGLSIIFLGQKK